jgi:hypothetical protein
MGDYKGGAFQNTSFKKDNILSFFVPFNCGISNYFVPLPYEEEKREE